MRVAVGMGGGATLSKLKDCVRVEILLENTDVWTEFFKTIPAVYDDDKHQREMFGSSEAGRAVTPD